MKIATLVHSRAFRLSATSFALTLALSACGGGSSTTSGGTTAESAATPMPIESTPYAGEHRHHRHRHHRSGAYGTAAAGGAAVGSGAAVAAASPGGGSWPCNDAQFVKDQQEFATGGLEGDQPVDVCGVVTRVLPAKDTRSGEHGYYYVQVAPGDTIEIVSDLGEMDAPAWPWVKTGDYSYVQGRYYYDSATSQGIDWTHHGTSRTWNTPGYVVVGGTEYQ